MHRVSADDFSLAVTRATTSSGLLFRIATVYFSKNMTPDESNFHLAPGFVTALRTRSAKHL